MRVIYCLIADELFAEIVVWIVYPSNSTYLIEALILSGVEGNITRTALVYSSSIV